MLAEVDEVSVVDADVVSVLETVDVTDDVAVDVCDVKSHLFHRMVLMATFSLAAVELQLVLSRSRRPPAHVISPTVPNGSSK